MTAWQVIQTRPRTEFLVSERLTELGRECFVPVDDSPEPCALFPGYAFFQGEGWHVRRIRVRLAGYSSPRVIGAVHEDVVDALRAPHKPAGERNGSNGHLRPGQRVRVTDGLLIGFVGTIQSMPASDRIVMLHGWFDRQVPIEIAARNVELWVDRRQGVT